MGDALRGKLPTAPEGPLPRWRHYFLLLLSALLLVPNDLCENPQNWWWVQHVGASPLTYAAAVNALILLTTRGPSRRITHAAWVLALLCYAAGVYHRLVGGY